METTSSDIQLMLTQLTMKDITHAFPDHTFTPAEKRSRAKLEDAVLDLCEDAHTILRDVAVNKKRKKEHVITEALEHVHQPSTNEEDLFFETVSEDFRQRCIADFIDSTGTAAITTSICAVCAGRFFAFEISEVKLSELKKKYLLPSKPHSAHVLTDGMLLHRRPTSFHIDNNGDSFANVCNSCMLDLEHDKTPAFSLANGMWIGRYGVHTVKVAYSKNRGQSVHVNTHILCPKQARC